VKTLSGGERNRLLLARLFTRPANLLILDEPTNDLDLETLELLENELVEWPGTLLLVSHDRRFLDNVVTSTLVFEGDGRIGEYIGGYEDWVRTRDTIAQDRAGSDEERLRPERSGGTKPGEAGSPSDRKKKLSYNEQREVESLPARIEALETEQRELQARISGPEFYKEPRTAIDAALARAEALEREVLDAYVRWSDLDGRR
jgi:ATP-binding cassette subfamily F protein uup